VKIGIHENLDVLQILLDFHGEVRLEKIGGKSFLVKRHFDTPVNMEGVRVILETLSLRDSEQRVLGYAQALENFHRRQEILLQRNLAQRIAKQHAHRDLVRELRANSLRKKKETTMTTKSSAPATKNMTKAQLKAEIERLKTALAMVSGFDVGAHRNRLDIETKLAEIEPLVKKAERSATRSC
jgi:hypothetical protein